ncbi:hypothetical protein L198_04423 [Cryptococcus wingfieldii CBS 7118]|uniref:Uncharacterized protein n=1 Tax=Cryptococcus wingfieldii CBS 7118 TaxID=1295528 RepID=A0A1E3J587_9TREE|nr:hypothetical protein L198_04423 [Cryptococcus wingfieldii CBS 7118]ODN95805.1 hypothetical protein L198_04423 [Cryptococcus wingfieldii CBS 7118]
MPSTPDLSLAALYLGGDAAVRRLPRSEPLNDDSDSSSVDVPRQQAPARRLGRSAPAEDDDDDDSDFLNSIRYNRPSGRLPRSTPPEDASDSSSFDAPRQEAADLPRSTPCTSPSSAQHQATESFPSSASAQGRPPIIRFSPQAAAVLFDGAPADISDHQRWQGDNLQSVDQAPIDSNISNGRSQAVNEALADLALTGLIRQELSNMASSAQSQENERLRSVNSGLVEVTRIQKETISLMSELIVVQSEMMGRKISEPEYRAKSRGITSRLRTLVGRGTVESE